MMIKDLNECARCALKDKSKPILFTMARLDNVKNLTGQCENSGKRKHI